GTHESRLCQSTGPTGVSRISTRFGSGESKLPIKTISILSGAILIARNVIRILNPPELLAAMNGLGTIRLQCLNRGADVIERYYTAKGTVVVRNGHGELRDRLPGLLEESGCFLRKQHQSSW